MKKLLAALCAATIPCFAYASNTVFSDDFESSAFGGNVVPTGWTVTNGTVDVVYPGWFNSLCAGGTGKCVDLDGSTSHGGTLVKSLTLNAGVTYTASFDLAGNQRAAGTDKVRVEFGSAKLEFEALAATAPWTRYSLIFTPSQAKTYELKFRDFGADNQGAVLDNVTVTAAVPEPETFAMMIAGLGLLGVVGRRRKAGQAATR